MGDNDNNSPAAVCQIPPPEKFSFKPEEWTKWIRRFERYRKATGLDSKPGETQMNNLIYSMGEEAEDVLCLFNLTDEESADYDTVKEKFESHFVIKKNVIFERAKFKQRVQKPDEPVENFITDLFSLVEYCEYGALKDQFIRDQIVIGITDKSLSEKLQLDAELTLEKAMNQVRQKESIKKQQDIFQPSSSVDRVFTTTQQKPRHKQRQKWVKTKQQAKPNGTSQAQYRNCSRCLGPPHGRPDCPARNNICNICNKKGHFAKACYHRKSGSRSALYEVNAAQNHSDSESEFFLGGISAVDTIGKHNENPWIASIMMNGQLTKFKLDTGADVTVIPAKWYYKQCLSQPLKPANRTLYGPCRYKMNCKGTFTTSLSTRDVSTQEQIYVIEGLEQPLLGRQAAEKLKLISHSVNNITKSSPQSYKTEIMNKYPKLFMGLGQMDTGEYTITLQNDAKPFAISTPRRVPLPLYETTKKELDRMLEMEVISKVENPTEWCAPMVVTPKPNGKVRICVDLSVLNKYVKRENHPLPAVDTTLSRLAGAKVFSKIDANSGFWQIKLSEESRPLSTFITPWGRFQFNVLPYGINSGSEKFQKCMSQILEGLDGVEVSMDDILIHGNSQTQHDQRINVVLSRLEKAKVTLNKEKCVFSVPEVEYLGHKISERGIKPDTSKVKCIHEMPPPKNVHEVRVFLGMVNHLGKFAEHLADKTKPIRELLQSDKEWIWDQAQQQAFDRVKSEITQAPVLALYDTNRETKISADSSSYGLGGVLLQKQDDTSWRPVCFMSRSLTPTEMRYAQIEKEALALTWACERTSDLIIGKSILAETDHKPLVPLLTTHTLDQLPPRIQRYRMRLMRFDFKEIKHVPGKEMYIADALSRCQQRNSPRESTISNEEMDAYISSIIDCIPITDNKLCMIREAQEEDEVSRLLKTYTTEGWPEKHQLKDALKPYWSSRGEISMVQGILLKGSRLLIPSPMRLDILDRIHEGHQGIVKCRERAKETVWWPGLSRQIQDLVENCRTCAIHRNIRAEPLMPTPAPERPWQRVATDLFHLKNKDYLIVIDYFSRFIEVAALNNSTKSTDVINALKGILARHGIPEELRSDNGPQFSCGEFAQFSKEWGFRHNTSSPRFPQSNGEAERGVQTIKNILKKEKDIAKSLLAYRATPLACGYSPAQLLMGRKLRTTVPIFHTQLKPYWPSMEQQAMWETINKVKQKNHFDSHHGVRNLPPIKTGTTVHITDLNNTGTILQKGDNPRSYIVETTPGSLTRNRKHLIPLPSPKPLSGQQISDQYSPNQLAGTRSSDTTSQTTSTPAKQSTPVNRPRRIIKPSLKVRENLGLC